MDNKQANQLLSTKREINWIKVLYQLQINVSAVFAVGYIFRYGCMWTTLFFSLMLSVLAVLGVTAGSHRLWAHNTYKATIGLRIFLMIFQTCAGHGSIYDWVKCHRLHHKHFGTDLDPYNPSKGFLYAHIFSFLRDLSPAQEEALKEIDMSDLEKDGVVMFQQRWYKTLFVIFVLLLPMNAPAEYWGEGLVTSSFVAGWLRYAIALHLCWLIHSATCVWGLKLGEKYPADNNFVFILTKTYWLSYHYIAPWDYQSSEYGKYGTDCITKFIRVCAALEYAYDLKTIDSRTVRSALTKAVIESKPLTDCLIEFSENREFIPKEEHLVPKK